ncbi:MAG: AAA family ATPase [Saprospiraceae bacterium]|jgi:predicted ATPase
MVSEIQFTNYKIFKEKQSLKLKPITVLLGKNNSGKSAVAKLPLMIGNLLYGEPINWRIKVGSDSKNSVELGSGFKDLIYNRNSAGALNIILDSENYSVNFSCNQEDGFLDLAINDIDIKLDGDIDSIKLPIGDAVILELKFSHDYIGAIRVSPESDYQNSAEKFNKIGINGQNAYPILIQDFENGQKLLNKVSSWYSKKFEGWGINIKKIDSSEIKYEIVLENGLSSINIRQTGQGIHQVLPLIVRSYMNEVEPTLIVVEEPETHLHPAAHGDLAERFVDSFIEDSNKRYLIETHSQNFVLRLRRLIAEKKIKPFDIALYYIDYNAKSRTAKLN